MQSSVCEEFRFLYSIFYSHITPTLIHKSEYQLWSCEYQLWSCEGYSHLFWSLYYYNCAFLLVPSLRIVRKIRSSRCFQRTRKTMSSLPGDIQILWCSCSFKIHSYNMFITTVDLNILRSSSVFHIPVSYPILVQCVMSQHTDGTTIFISVFT